MSEEWKQLKEGAIEREEAFEDKCAIHAMQAYIANREEEKGLDLHRALNSIVDRAFYIAWKMAQERRDFSSDWEWIPPEERSTTE